MRDAASDGAEADNADGRAVQLPLLNRLPYVVTLIPQKLRQAARNHEHPRQHELGNVERVGERMLAQRRCRAAIAVAAGVGGGVVQLDDRLPELILGFRLYGVAEPGGECLCQGTAHHRRRIDGDLGIAADGLDQDRRRRAAKPLQTLNIVTSDHPDLHSPDCFSPVDLFDLIDSRFLGRLRWVNVAMSTGWGAEEPAGELAAVEMELERMDQESFEKRRWHYEHLDVARAPLFFSVYFVMTGIHGLHVIIGMAVIYWLIRRASRGEFGPKYFTPVEMTGLYWHFVDLVWIYLFPLLYLVS